MRWALVGRFDYVESFAGLVLINACGRYFAEKMSVEFEKLAQVCGQVLVQMVEDEPVELQVCEIVECGSFWSNINYLRLCVCVQLYGKKFAKMLCTFYRAEGSFEISLQTALMWACILPDSEQYFVDIYGTLKQHLFAKNHLQFVVSFSAIFRRCFRGFW